MQNIILDNISLIIFLPLWIFLIIMCGRFFSVYVNKKIIYILTLVSSLLGIYVCASGLRYFTEALEWTHPFLRINNFSILFGLHADKLSLILGLILFLISFAVQLFSISYMKDEKKNYRFFALLNLFNFGMSGLLFSQNLYQMYIFWEIVGVVSYLLIGFDYKNAVKSNAAKRVFLLNRIGDTALIGGLILVSYEMYSNINNILFVTLSFSDLNSISALMSGYTSGVEFSIICGLFIFAGIVKLAQYPFNVWLLDAMEAKVPVSALLHSATMVTAGIYLTMRMMPFYTLSGVLIDLIIIIGIITALICSLKACIEIHPKKVLAYSTSANLGLIFVLTGLGNIKAALIFLVAHAFIKSALFLSLPKDNNNSSFTRFGFFILNSLSLSGLILSGIPMKEALFSGVSGNTILSKLILLTIFLSAFYIARLVYLIKNNTCFEKNFGKSEAGGLIILLVLNIGLCTVLTNGKFEISIPYITALVAVLSVIILNKFNLLEKLNTPPKMSEKVLYCIVPYVFKKLSSFSDYLDKNIFADYKLFITASKSGVKAVHYIEENIMNKYVKFISDLALGLSKFDNIFQSKNVQTYNAYAFIILTIIIAFVITAYMFIITNIEI